MTFPSRARRADEYYERMVTDLVTAFCDAGDKSGISPDQRTALTARSSTSGSNSVRLLTFGDIADVLVEAGWRPSTR